MEQYLFNLSESVGRRRTEAVVRPNIWLLLVRGDPAVALHDLERWLVFWESGSAGSTT